MTVSVILITFNQEKFITQAIEGVLMQKVNFDYELIIANDCSPDNTDNIVSDIKLNHPKANCIKYFNQKANIGMMKNFIFAINEAKGKYIAICEGDDYWTDPLKLQKQVDFLEANKDVAITFCNTLVIDESNTDNNFTAYQNIQIVNSCIPTIPIPNDVTDITVLAKGNYIHTPGVVFRNSSIEQGLPKYMGKIPIGDWPLHMYVARTGKIKYFSEVMCAYRVHKTGVFSQQSYGKILFGELMIYPAMINEGVFDENIIKIWEHKMEEMLVVFLKLDDETNEEIKNTVLETYSKNLPLILFKVFKRIQTELEAKKTTIENKENRRIFKILEKISTLKKLW